MRNAKEHADYYNNERRPKVQRRLNCFVKELMKEMFNTNVKSQTGQ